MDEIKEKLRFQVERSQVAYREYLKDKRFFQAKRIFEANTEIHRILSANAHEWDDTKHELIIRYLFHLEDWFAQYEELSSSRPSLTDEFIFERLEGSPPFPKDISELFS